MHPPINMANSTYEVQPRSQLFGQNSSACQASHVTAFDTGKYQILKRGLNATAKSLSLHGALLPLDFDQGKRGAIYNEIGFPTQYSVQTNVYCLTYPC